MKGSPAMPVIRTQWERNKIPAVRSALPSILQERVISAARGFRDLLQKSLRDGVNGLESDTEALENSLYITSPFGSDYDECLKRTALAYLESPSRWRDLVQEYLTPEAYTQGHLAARLLGQDALPATDKDVAIVMVATMLAIGTFYELGHLNKLTGQYEHRPWMGPGADEFSNSFGAFFVGLENDLRRMVG